MNKKLLLELLARYIQVLHVDVDVVAHENNLSDICTNHNNIQSPEPGREWKIREVR